MRPLLAPEVTFLREAPLLPGTLGAKRSEPLNRLESAIIPQLTRCLTTALL
jgi:hypothetical protein